MLTSMSQFGLPAVIAGLVLSIGSAARAQEKTPFPAFAGQRVYVAGVPDRYDDLAGQIKRLERSSPQTYYVVVVESTGPGGSATKDYADELFETWRSQASRRGLSFDPERSVITVVALHRHQVAVHPGATLRTQFGLHAATVERDLINDVFIPLAKQDKYPEAISALLDATNNWIAARDSRTAAVPVAGAVAKPASGSQQVSAESLNPAKTSPKVSEAPPYASTVQTPDSNRSAVRVPPGPLRETKSSWSPAIVLGVLVLAIGLIGAGWAWVVHRRTRDRVAARLKGIKSQAVEVMDRLDGLKERLKLLPTAPDFSRAMSGQTLELYNTVNEKMGKLWDGWLEVMEVLDKAEKLAARSGSLLSQKTLGEAEDLINRQGSFHQIENQAQAIASDLDRLDQAHQAARVVLEAITTARPKLDVAIETIAKVDLPTSPYQEDLAAVDAGTTQASSLLAPDPLGTKTVLEQLKARTESLLSRIERVASLFRDAQQVKTSLESIKRQTAGHRAQGLKLVEDGGNPDHALDQGDAAHSETLAALRAGDPDAASQKLDAARSLVQEAQATIEKVQKARAFCERDQPARVRETERLCTALPQAESYQNDLEREFARSSWQAVARNLDQARALLATFDRQAQSAAAAATSTTQEYVSGAAALEELARQQQIVLRLMSGLGEQLNSLIDVRNECRKLNEQLTSRDREAEQYIRQYDPIVGDVARNNLATAHQSKAEILARSGEPRPDWPALRQSLVEVIEDLSIVRSQAEDDVKRHQELTREFDQVRQTASRVYALLAGHQEDRLAANQNYQAAADLLDRIGLQLTEPRGASAGLLEQLRGAAADLDRALQLAREDIRLAAQAQSEIDEAGRSIQQAQGYASMGFLVDTSTPESQLLRAQQLLQTQNYEQSIQCAGAAIQAARQVYHAAKQQAMAQQAAEIEEQRRRAAQMAAPQWNGVSFGAAAATAAAAVILDNAASAAPPDPGPATAVGSWSSDTGQGSW